MAPLFTRSWRAAAALLVIALMLPAMALGRGGGEETGGMGALRQALVTALAGSRAGDAVDTLGDSLAMLGAKWQIERKARVDAARESQEAAAATKEEAAAPAEEEVDPEDMPAASAGSNGSYEPGSGPDAKGAVFAHTRAGPDGTSSSILLSGIALAPPDAPEAVKGVINNANAIVGRPYIWGGGHGSFYSYGYDCSGSVSFALFGGGLIPEPLTSGSLEGWGAPGPGKWITVYANAEHTFAEIAGLRWDTVGDENGTGPRWHLAPTSTAGFVVRHPPGL